MIIAGLDLSKIHYGMCFTDGKNIDYSFMWSTKGIIDSALKEGFMAHYLEPVSWYRENISNNPERYTLYCAEKIESFLIDDFVKIGCNNNDNNYIAIEGYSYGSMKGQLVQLSEVSGIVKQLLMRMGWKIRTHDPNSLKFWATGKGEANKPLMLNEALKHVHIAQEYHDVAYDIADAYFLMDMVKVELQVRKNPSLLDKLTERQKHIFLRVTESNPVNLLDRSFIEL